MANKTLEVPQRQHHQEGKILVIGASGYIGSHLVPRLLEQGYGVRAAGRDPAALQRRQWHGVQCVHCDVLEPESIARALEGIDQVYYLVHSMSAGEGYAERDSRGSMNLAEQAAQGQVRHIIYLGTLLIAGTHSPHLISRARTGEALRSTGVTVTELRAPIIIGSGSAPFEVFRDVVNHLPGMAVPGQLSHRSPPIGLEDLLFYLLAFAEATPLTGNIVEVCGPETVSYIELMQAFAKFRGKPFFILRLPGLPISVIRWLIPMFSTAPKGIIHALLGGVNHDITANPELVQQHFPRDLVRLQQAFETVFTEEFKRRDSISWYHGNMIFRLHDPTNAFYGERIVVTKSARVSAKNVWRELAKIGGDNGYFFLDILWRIRGIIDMICGGPGMVRYRDNAQELYSGERVDTWVIKEAKRYERLLLQFMMRSPGAGCLEFQLEQRGEQCQLSIVAYWHPKGLWGRCYWLLFKPALLLLFHGLSQTLFRRAGQ